MNAIILAAGMGTRLRPLTDDRPKSLVETAGESFFSRQLRLLDAAGIEDVTVVTGYKAEAFDPWKGRPGLSFVHNDHYHDRNNLWSMYLARDRLGNSMVLEGDVWIAEGLIPGNAPEKSSWFSGWREGMHNEWVIRPDASGRVRRIDVASGSGFILSGISYWTAADGRFIASLLEELAPREKSYQLFWDEIPRSHLDEIEVMFHKIEPQDWAEIDTLEDRAALEAKLLA
jgi:CTP:phosphocholine cytidylyltransferase-like protein